MAQLIRLEGELCGIDLADVGREIDRALIHLRAKRFVHEVDHEDTLVADVRGSVLQRAAGLALQPEHRQRRRLAEDVEERERRGVHDPGRPERRHQRDRTRDHEADEQLVAVMLLHRGEVVRQVGHGAFQSGNSTPTWLVMRP